MCVAKARNNEGLTLANKITDASAWSRLARFRALTAALRAKVLPASMVETMWAAERVRYEKDLGKWNEKQRTEGSSTKCILLRSCIVFVRHQSMDQSA